MGRWLRFLAGAGIFVGPAVTVGTYLLDGWHLLHLGLPPQALEGLGALIFFLSVGGLLYKWRPQPAIPILGQIARATAPTTPSLPLDDGMLDLIERWWTDYFPENAPAPHPVPYLSGAWHHVRDAKEDLKRRMTAL